MPTPLLHSKLFRQYWFGSNSTGGVGITAFTIEDAWELLSEAIEEYDLKVEMYEVIEDVLIGDLDQNHVIPNMSPPNFRGIWYPMLNARMRV